VEWTVAYSVLCVCACTLEELDQVHIDFDTSAAAGAAEMSYSEIEERFYRTIDLTPAVELDLTEELAQAQLHGHSRLFLLAIARMRNDWIYCHGDEEVKAYRARFASYAVTNTRRLTQEGLSLALIDNEEGYAQAAALMEFLDRQFQAYYIIRSEVTVDLTPAADSWYNKMAGFFGGPILQSQIEYSIVVDFALTRARRRAPALHVASTRLFAKAVPKPPSPAGSGTGTLTTSSSPTIVIQQASPAKRHSPSGSDASDESGGGLRRVPPKTQTLSLSTSGGRRVLSLSSVHETEEPPPSPPASKGVAAAAADANDADSDPDSSSSSSDSGSSEDTPLSVVGTGTDTDPAAVRHTRSASVGARIESSSNSNSHSHSHSHHSNNSASASVGNGRNAFIAVHVRSNSSGGANGKK
jgi:hypothetical protein